MMLKALRNLIYGTGGGADDLLSRVAALKHGTTVLVGYTFLGREKIIRANYSGQPGVELTYIKQGAEGNGDAGDQYTGLDRFGRCVDQRWLKTSDGTHRERVKYGYDRASNRKWRQNGVAGTGQDEFYTYDNLYQLTNLDRGTLTGTPPTGIAGTPSWEEDFTYDPTGNWRGASTGYLTKVSGTTTLNQNRTHSKANEITDITESPGTAWPTPTQNLVGNMTVMPQPANLGSSYDGKYDAWNRLVEVKITGGAVQGTYAYDGFHRRVSKVAGGNTRHFYYSREWQIVEERLNALTTADRQFVWGLRYADDLVLRDKGSERFYVLHDYFHPTAVIDTSAVVQERYGYDAFGLSRVMDSAFAARANSLYEWETRYGAYRWDSESSLYQVRYRYLHPRLGRWSKRDPLKERGGLNLYCYADNEPVSSIDPSGLLSVPKWLRRLCKSIIEEAKDMAKDKAKEKAAEKAKEIFGDLISDSWEMAGKDCETISNPATPKDEEWVADCISCAARACALGATTPAAARICFTEKAGACHAYIAP